MDFYAIKSNEDVRAFLEKTNSLHDGYIIGVQYTNDAFNHVDENGYLINPDATRLILRILVTSIWNTVVEIEFEAIREWQIKERLWDMTDTSVVFDENDLIVWSNDVFTDMSDLKNRSYVIAASMKWRIVT